MFMSNDQRWDAMFLLQQVQAARFSGADKLGNYGSVADAVRDCYEKYDKTLKASPEGAYLQALYDLYDPESINGIPLRVLDIKLEKVGIPVRPLRLPAKIFCIGYLVQQPEWHDGFIRDGGCKISEIKDKLHRLHPYLEFDMDIPYIHRKDKEEVRKMLDTHFSSLKIYRLNKRERETLEEGGIVTLRDFVTLERSEKYGTLEEKVRRLHPSLRMGMKLELYFP